MSMDPTSRNLIFRKITKLLRQKNRSFRSFLNISSFVTVWGNLISSFWNISRARPFGLFLELRFEDSSHSNPFKMTNPLWCFPYWIRLPCILASIQDMRFFRPCFTFCETKNKDISNAFVSEIQGEDENDQFRRCYYKSDFI